jgi:hypothetical protein
MAPESRSHRGDLAMMTTRHEGHRRARVAWARSPSCGSAGLLPAWEVDVVRLVATVPGAGAGLLTWASCRPASVGTCRSSSQSILFPRRRMTAPSAPASCAQNMCPQSPSGTPGPGHTCPALGKLLEVKESPLRSPFHITPTHILLTWTPSPSAGCPSSLPTISSPTLQGQPQWCLLHEAFLDCSHPRPFPPAST